MAIDREKFEELCSAYFLGVLDKDDLRDFQNALESADAEMKKTFFDFEQVALHLPLSVEPVEPSPTVKERILLDISKRAEEPRGNLLTMLASILGFDKPRVAIAVSLILAFVVFGLIYYTLILKETVAVREHQLAALQSESSRQQRRLLAVEDELTRKTELLKVLQSPRIEVVLMNGLEVNPAGYGKIILDPEKRTAILQISNLPAVPQDKDYQLWVIKDKKPISAGVFTPKAPEREAFFKIDQLVEVNKRTISAFAITLEPKGGVPQPTGKMYMIGSPAL